MSTDSALSLFSTKEMDEVFSLSRQLQYMTRFEWALTSALEKHGIVGKGASDALEPFLDAGFADPPSLWEQAHQTGNLAIPLLRALTAAVSVGDEQAARSIHFGATSQDVLDTALVLQMRDALALIRGDLETLDASLVKLIRAHAATVLAGRTWLQDGPPVTLGLKIAGWLAALRRHRERLQAAGARALVLQFGGAVGTLAALGENGPAVSQTLAQKLELSEPEVPWHAHRDNLVEVAAALGLLVGTLGKIAKDISLLMQTEVAELSEPGGEGRGASSTMPHKRNPVASATILAAAVRVPGLVSTMMIAMVQEHERGLGGWQAEWETLPDIFRLTAAALSRSLEIAGGLEVDEGQMLANLEATHGLALAEAVSAALVPRIGRAQAHEVLQQASQRAVVEKKHLRDILLEMPQTRDLLSQAELDHLLDPHNYLGSTQIFIDRVLRGTHARR